MNYQTKYVFSLLNSIQTDHIIITDSTLYMYNLTSQHMQAHKQEYVHKQNTQYPYENVSFFFHRDITVAIKPASNAVQSKNI
jgi:hypothetical protein